MLTRSGCPDLDDPSFLLIVLCFALWRRSNKHWHAATNDDKIVPSTCTTVGLSDFGVPLKSVDAERQCQVAKPVSALVREDHFHARLISTASVVLLDGVAVINFLHP